MGGTPVGAPLIGTLSEVAGPRSGLLVGGAVTALSGVAAAVVVARRRSLRIEPHLLRRRPCIQVHQQVPSQDWDRDQAKASTT
jgi:hypothetical protein